MTDTEVMRALVKTAFNGDVGRALASTIDLVEEAVVKKELAGDTGIRALAANYLLSRAGDIEFKNRLPKLR